MRQFFDRIEIWLEEPQAVLSGWELLGLIAVMILWLFVHDHFRDKWR